MHALNGRARPKDTDELAMACESAVRMALSYVVAPSPAGEDPVELVRGALGRWISA